MVTPESKNRRSKGQDSGTRLDSRLDGSQVIRTPVAESPLKLEIVGQRSRGDDGVDAAHISTSAHAFGCNKENESHPPYPQHVMAFFSNQSFDWEYGLVRDHEERTTGF